MDIAFSCLMRKHDRPKGLIQVDHEKDNVSFPADPGSLAIPSQHNGE